MVIPIVSQHFLIADVKITHEDQTKGQTTLWKRLAETLAAIRLATSSRVSLVDPSIVYSGLKWAEKGLLSGSRPELENKYGGHPVFATSEDVKLARRLAKAISEKPRLGSMVRRFNFGMGRESREDRLVDLVIGLESLYVPDSHSELKYRLRTRCSCHLGKSDAKRFRISEQVGDLYDMRSSIVHGTSITLEQAAKKTVFRDSPLDAISCAESLLSNGLRNVLVMSPAINLAKHFDKHVLTKIGRNAH